MTELKKLNAAAMQSMRAGDFEHAKVILEGALRLNNKSIAIWLNLAAAYRATGNVERAIATTERALELDPRCFPALLMKGSLLEQSGAVRQAARIYGFAIGLAPPEEMLDSPTTHALREARRKHALYLEELQAFVERSIGIIREPSATAQGRRINTFIDHTLRRRPIFRQDPTEFYYPDLPSIEFYDRSEFPWLTAFESECDKIRKELQEVSVDCDREFVPYIDYSDSLPLDQWKDLNRSRRWSAFHLFLNGQKVAINARRCPKTMNAIEQLPQPNMAGRSPAAMFSALQGDARIPPHNGVSNTRLVVHLPLVVPGLSEFRVGSQTRNWIEGEAWIFDDTIEHEAWNRSDRTRTILICDIWNPRISKSERALIVDVISALDSYHGADDVGKI